MTLLPFKFCYCPRCLVWSLVDGWMKQKQEMVFTKHESFNLPPRSEFLPTLFDPLNAYL